MKEITEEELRESIEQAHKDNNCFEIKKKKQNTKWNIEFCMIGLVSLASFAFMVFMMDGCH